jgi:hypothetical protein
MTALHAESQTALSVAIPITVDGGGIAEAISTELENLGHRPFTFDLDGEVPWGMDAVLLFGPFGKFLHVPQQFGGLPQEQRPVFVYWNTEGLPDLRLPPALVKTASVMRSWVGRASAAPGALARLAAGLPPLSLVEHRLLRFRYVGDYLYAHRMGWIDVFADISAVYATYLRGFGLPAIAAPFGSYPDWYADLNLKRDIDVLWMGKRATRRRSEALNRVRADLRQYGVEVHVVDNEENPFVFGPERTHLLNRAKITLNLLRTWYDENSLRICLAAPNRSLVVSEPLLPHVPLYQAGEHYVSAPIENLAEVIVRYLHDEPARQRILENAYQLSTRKLTWRSSMNTMMEAAVQVYTSRRPGAGVESVPQLQRELVSAQGEEGRS